MGSDGLFDNVFDDDVISCIKDNLLKNGKGELTDVNKASECLARKAEK